MNILTLNAGSNSLKFEIVAETTDPTRDSPGFGSSLVTGVCDNIGKKGSNLALLDNKRVRHKEEIDIPDYGRAGQLVLDWIDGGGAETRGIRRLSDIHRIGHRVVHGADYFQGAAVVTDQVIRQIAELEDLAPLHNRPALEVIRVAQQRVGPRTQMFAVFDTGFHRTIPDEAAFYPLPPEKAQQYKIRRYGFHGLSHRYMMLRYAQIKNRPIEQLNLVTMHLEGGSSATAIRGGKSIDTSMGFTPLEGLMMGTRCGDIDPAIVTYLMRKERLDADGIDKFLNKNCGLLGVSGMSADTRELRKHLSDNRVNLAINMFCYRVRKYLGAYLAALGGAEALIFGGGIGENTPVIRERILQNFGWCGATLDLQLNKEAVDREACISTPDSPLQVWVIPSQEGLMMAREIAEAEQA